MYSDINESGSPPSSSDEMSPQRGETRQRSWKPERRLVWMSIAVLVVIVAACVIIVVAVNRHSSNTTQSGPKEEESTSRNELLERFFYGVKEAYYECHPDLILYEKISEDEVKARYRPFDYSPSSIKKIADTAAKLRSEFSQLITEEFEATLTERELKGVYEMRQFLRLFGGRGPYDSSYYTGVWMLGPNTMVWEPIKSMFRMMHSLFLHPKFKLNKLTDFEWGLHIMSMFKHSVNNYTENMKLGVKAGMVRNVEACKAGLKAFKMYYRGFALNNETGL